jgi:hypothetical protein
MNKKEKDLVIVSHFFENSNPETTRERERERERERVALYLSFEP